MTERISDNRIHLSEDLGKLAHSSEGLIAPSLNPNGQVERIGRRTDKELRVGLQNALFKALVEADHLPRTSEEATIFTIEGFANHVNTAIAPFLIESTPLVDLEIPINVYMRQQYLRDERYDRKVIEQLMTLKSIKKSYGRAMASMRQMRVFTVGALHQASFRTENQERCASILKPAFALPHSTQ